MRKPSLTFDTFVAALAVVGVSTSAGCSKAERSGVSAEPPSAAASAAPAPPPAASAAPAPPPAASAAAEPAAPPPAPTAAAPAASGPAREAARNAAPRGVTATPVDGGGPSKKGDVSGGSMTCGAGMCSADMKKGN